LLIEFSDDQEAGGDEIRNERSAIRHPLDSYR
jgi:hypothetical protein